MKKRVFYGSIKAGLLELDHKAMFREYTATLSDMEVEIVIRAKSKDPSVEQWGYLYANVYEEFANHFGWTIDDTDTHMKKRFMKAQKMILPDGLIITKSLLDRAWLAKYVDFCIRLCADEGIVVPPPRTKKRGVKV
jgi:hypothetical protein